MAHPYEKKFYERIAPPAGASASDIVKHLNEPFPGLKSLKRVEAAAHIAPLFDEALKDFGHLPYERFEEKILHRIRELHKRERLWPGAYWGVNNIYEALPTGLSFDEKMRALRLNVTHLREWRKLKPEKLKDDFELLPALSVHPESPFSFVAYHKPMNIDVATVGFRLLHGPTGKIVLSVNNIQGMKGKTAHLEALSGVFGENWRTALLKRAVAYARAHGFEVQGETPQARTVLKLAGMKELKRLSRQYGQTYRKAGFKKVGENWALHQAK